MANLQNKVLVVGIEKGKPSFGKQCKDTAKYVDAHVNGDGAVTTTKTLLDRKSISDITKIESDWSDFHKKNTIPYRRAKAGCALIMVENLTNYQAEYRKTYREWEREVDAFCDNYDNVISESKIRQGNNFNMSELPQNKEEMRARFKFHMVQPYALEDPNDLAFALSDKEVEEVRKVVSDEIMNSIKESLRLAFDAMTDFVDSVEAYNPNGKTNEKHGYHESRFSNLEEAADMLDVVNFTDNEGIKEIQTRMREFVSGHTAVSTKQDAEVRRELVKEGKEIIKSNFSAFGY
jgi:hypothetical protein